eukprot:9487682-Pyramimonas_sp.AAC.1
MPPSFGTHTSLRYKSVQEPLRVIETPITPHRITIVDCTDVHLKLQCGKLLRDCMRHAAPDSPTPLLIVSGWASWDTRSVNHFRLPDAHLTDRGDMSANDGDDEQEEGEEIGRGRGATRMGHLTCQGGVVMMRTWARCSEGDIMMARAR